MADRSKRVPSDRGGDWFVDTTCIDCDVARQVAPGLIEADEDGLSYFVRPPETEKEVRDAWRALLACPTGSIGAPKGMKPPEGVFPYRCAGGTDESGDPDDPGVFYLGYTSRDSFGANSFYVPPRPDLDRGGLMVDAPRWRPDLADRVEALGGVEHVLLTHRDDVADYDRYADRFDARVWIHEVERGAAPDATDLLELDAADPQGEATAEVAPGVTALHVPGHTRGSILFAVDDRYLFTGDTIYWSRHLDDVSVFPSATWYSWDALVGSMDRLAGMVAAGDLVFEWVLAGHGGRGRAPAGEMAGRLEAMVERMRAGEVPNVW